MEYSSFIFPRETALFKSKVTVGNYGYMTFKVENIKELDAIRKEC